MSATKPPGYDDRFVAPLEPSRRGAHRARMSPLVAALPVVAVVTVVVAAVALAWTLFGGGLFGGGGDEASSGAVTTAAAGPSTTGAPSTTAAEPTSDPPVEVDRTQAVIVLNSTRVSGLAKKATTELKGKGWSGAKFSYAEAEARETTAIYYATDEQKDAADALAEDLGVGEVEQSASMATDGITVVLGTDYTS
jgi:hypothetical protein